MQALVCGVTYTHMYIHCMYEEIVLLWAEFATRTVSSKDTFHLFSKQETHATSFLLPPFTTSGSVALSNAYFGEGTGPIFLDDAACNIENHTSLIECFTSSDRDIGLHNCLHSEDASVICSYDCECICHVVWYMAVCSEGSVVHWFSHVYIKIEVLAKDSKSLIFRYAASGGIQPTTFSVLGWVHFTTELLR